MKNRSLLLLALIPAALAAQPTPRPSRAPKPAPAPQGVPMPAEPAMPPDAPDTPKPGVAPMAFSLAKPFPQFEDVEAPSWSVRYPQDPADSTYREARSMLKWRVASSLVSSGACR